MRTPSNRPGHSDNNSHNVTISRTFAEVTWAYGRLSPTNRLHIASMYL